MTKKQFESLRAKQDLSDLHYPSAKEWMWNYCLFLGKFTDSEGKNCDLGVYYNESLFQTMPDYLFSDATVFDVEEGSYKSGYMNLNEIITYDNKKLSKLDLYKQWGLESVVECWNRLQKLLNTI